MYNAITRNVAQAAVDEFNSRNYWRVGSGGMLKIESEHIFDREGLYAWVRPYCFYRQLCMYLSHFHCAPNERAKLPAIFGIDEKTFDKELKNIGSALTQDTRNIRKILTNIVRKAGLPQKPAYLKEEPQSNVAKPYKRLTCQDIARTMSSIFNELELGYVTEADVMDTRRLRPIALCRQFSMYTARYSFPEKYASFPAIAKNFSGRDHTTVIHSVNKIENMIACNDSRAMAVLDKICSAPILSPLQQDGIRAQRRISFETWGGLLRHENSSVLSLPPITSRPPVIEHTPSLIA